MLGPAPKVVAAGGGGDAIRPIGVALSISKKAASRTCAGCYGGSEQSLSDRGAGVSGDEAVEEGNSANRVLRVLKSIVRHYFQQHPYTSEVTLWQP